MTTVTKCKKCDAALLVTTGETIEYRHIDCDGTRLVCSRCADDEELVALKARYDRLLAAAKDSRSKLSNAKYMLDMAIREAEGDEKKEAQ